MYSQRGAMEKVLFIIRPKLERDGRSDFSLPEQFSRISVLDMMFDILVTTDNILTLNIELEKYFLKIKHVCFKCILKMNKHI
jgi:hypothetical protein